MDSETGSTKTSRVPLLSNGKKTFDVFIIYSSADREFVLDLVKTLESKQYELKVCFHERDFIPGIPIFQNIETAIIQSLKTVIVFSEHFSKSAWCIHEARSTVTFGIDSEQSKLHIPLLIDKTPIPCTLKNNGVIDASGNVPRDTWLNLLLEAIRTPSQNKDLQQAPKLSTAKNSHVSFIHSDSPKDRKWVEQVESKLTQISGEYKFYKQTLINNIEDVTMQDIMAIVHTLEISEKTVIVVSNDFMKNESQRFIWNLSMMIVKDLKLPGGCLIPVHVDGIQIEENLSSITYLYASYNIDDSWWNKFLEALVSPEIDPQETAFDNHEEDIRIFRITELGKNDKWDSEGWRPVDITFASENRFVLADSKNQNLKLFSLSGNLLDEFRTVDNWASSLTRVKDSSIAAAYRKQNMIRIFGCKNKLEVEKGFKTDDNYRLYGIASFDKERLLVSYRDKPRVDIISLDGKWLKTFHDYVGNTPLFKDSRFIDVTSECVYVVDTTDRKLVCFSRKGSTRASQERLSTEYHIMRGIHCGKKENYVLVDANIKTFRLQKDDQGKERIVTKPFLSQFVGTTYMRSIAVNASESAIVLIYASDGKEMIRVFGMSNLRQQ